MCARMRPRRSVQLAMVGWSSALGVAWRSGRANVCSGHGRNVARARWLPSGVEGPLQHMGDPERTVRYCSAKALSFLKEPLSREYLKEALGRENEEMVVIQIQEALLELDSPQTPNGVASD